MAQHSATLNKIRFTKRGFRVQNAPKLSSFSTGVLQESLLGELHTSQSTEKGDIPSPFPFSLNTFGVLVQSTFLKYDHSAILNMLMN